MAAKAVSPTAAAKRSAEREARMDDKEDEDKDAAAEDHDMDVDAMPVVRD
jgi:hypothetical protein